MTETLDYNLDSMKNHLVMYKAFLQGIFDLFEPKNTGQNVYRRIFCMMSRHFLNRI